VSIADDVIVMVGNRVTNADAERKRRIAAERKHDILMDAVQTAITEAEEIFGGVIEIINDAEEDDDAEDNATPG
jgi:hypothetical protein